MEYALACDKTQDCAQQRMSNCMTGGKRSNGNLGWTNLRLLTLGIGGFFMFRLGKSYDCITWLHYHDTISLYVLFGMDSLNYLTTKKRSSSFTFLRISLPRIRQEEADRETD